MTTITDGEAGFSYADLITRLQNTRSDIPHLDQAWFAMAGRLITYRQRIKALEEVAWSLDKARVVLTLGPASTPAFVTELTGNVQLEYRRSVWLYGWVTRELLAAILDENNDPFAPPGNTSMRFLAVENYLCDAPVHDMCPPLYGDMPALGLQSGAPDTIMAALHRLHIVSAALAAYKDTFRLPDVQDPARLLPHHVVEEPHGRPPAGYGYNGQDEIIESELRAKLKDHLPALIALGDQVCWHLTRDFRKLMLPAT